MSERRRSGRAREFVHVPITSDPTGSFNCIELPSKYLAPMSAAQLTAGFPLLGQTAVWLQDVLGPLVIETSRGERKSFEAIAWLIAKAPEVAFRLRSLGAVLVADLRGDAALWSRVLHHQKRVLDPKTVDRYSYLSAAYVPKGEDPKLTVHLDQGTWQGATSNLSEIARALLEQETDERGAKDAPTYSAVEGTIARATGLVVDVVHVRCKVDHGGKISSIATPVADWAEWSSPDIEHIEKGTNVTFQSTRPVTFDFPAGWTPDAVTGVGARLKLEFSAEKRKKSGPRTDDSKAFSGAAADEAEANVRSTRLGLTVGPDGKSASAFLDPATLGLAILGNLQEGRSVAAKERAQKCSECGGRIESPLEIRKQYRCSKCGAKFVGALDDDGEPYLMIVDRGR
jgi:hypothetical protein